MTWTSLFNGYDAAVCRLAPLFTQLSAVLGLDADRIDVWELSHANENEIWAGIFISIITGVVCSLKARTAAYAELTAQHDADNIASSSRLLAGRGYH